MQYLGAERNPFILLPPANEVCEGYVFTGVCLSTGGACVLPVGGHACFPGVCGCRAGMCGCGGHAWLQGHVCGCKGGHSMVVGEHAWLQGGGHAWDMMRYGQ